MVLPLEIYALQLKMLLEGMNGAISPDEIIFNDRRQKLRRFGQTPPDRIEDKPGVIGRDECDVDAKARRVLNFGNLHSVNPLAILFADEVNLFGTLAQGCALQGCFETREASALIWSIGKDLTAYPAGKHAAHHERDLPLYAKLVDKVSRRFIVGSEHDNIDLSDLVCEQRIFHQVRVDRCDDNVWISIPQDVCDSFRLFLSQIAPSANMPDDVLDFENVVIDEGEIANPRHHKLKRDAASARARSPRSVL
ncbi:hypothetical protein ACVWZK_000216 [Bradyrhizobium sp. GM0.4]